MTGENAAPAEMPGVEERLRRILAEARIEPEPEASDFAVENIKALFAPKAEKPPTLADEAASSEIAVQSQPRIGAKRASEILPADDGRDQWKARALAAEAALAAERAMLKRIVDLHADWRLCMPKDGSGSV